MSDAVFLSPRAGIKCAKCKRVLVEPGVLINSYYILGGPCAECDPLEFGAIPPEKRGKGR
jgi:hypothetical protein